MGQRQKAENRNARPTDRERTDGKSQSAMGQGADRSHALLANCGAQKNNMTRAKGPNTEFNPMKDFAWIEQLNLR